MISHAWGKVVLLWATEWTARRPGGRRWGRAGAVARTPGSCLRAAWARGSSRGASASTLAANAAAPAARGAPKDRHRSDREGLRLPGLPLRPRRAERGQGDAWRFVERATRLYEQGPGEPEGSARRGRYVRRRRSGSGRDLEGRPFIAKRMAQSVSRHTTNPLDSCRPRTRVTAGNNINGRSRTGATPLKVQMADGRRATDAAPNIHH